MALSGRGVTAAGWSVTGAVLFRVLRLAVELDVSDEARVAVDAVDDALQSGVGEADLVGASRAGAVASLSLTVVVHRGVVLHRVLKFVLWRVVRLWTEEGW